MRSLATGIHRSGGCYARFLLLLWLLGPIIPVFVSAADHTQCASGQLDWYTSVVGETPCRTYERLRQVCNNDYQVPRFTTTLPGDTCNDQVSDCCCNTVAFALSMLCMNCQQDKLGGEQTGIDAPPKTYDTYRGSCGAGTSHSLGPDIQNAVCNENIKLDDFLYGGWDDGAWFYVWTKENAQVKHAASGNQTFTHCSNQGSSESLTATSPLSTLYSASASSATLPLSSSESSPTPSGNATGSLASNDHGGSGLSPGASAAIGGVIGVLGVLGVAAAGFFLWRRHKRAKHAYTAPSNVARRLSYNPFVDRPLTTPTAVAPYLIPTDTRGQLDGDLKPNRYLS